MPPAAPTVTPPAAAVTTVRCTLAAAGAAPRTTSASGACLHAGMAYAERRCETGERERSSAVWMEGWRRAANDHAWHNELQTTKLSILIAPFACSSLYYNDLCLKISQNAAGAWISDATYPKPDHGCSAWGYEMYRERPFEFQVRCGLGC